MLCQSYDRGRSLFSDSSWHCVSAKSSFLCYLVGAVVLVALDGALPLLGGRLPAALKGLSLLLTLPALIPSLPTLHPHSTHRAIALHFVGALSIGGNADCGETSLGQSDSIDLLHTGSMGSEDALPERSRPA